MKSKISFFNKTIFMKNVTLYWPIWGIYALIVVIMQPGLVWLFNNMSYFSNRYTDEMQFRDLMDTLHFENYVVLIAFAALFAGMALYSYMYNNKSANMIHSLPVDRTQLYGTTIISGLAFLIVPLFGAAVLSTLLCLLYTIPGIGYVWLWFFVMSALAIIAFSIVSICALFTGHIVVLPMYVVAVNLLSWLVYYLISVVITTFGFGVTTLGSNAEDLAGVFCPIQCFSENLSWTYNYSDAGELIDISLTGVEFLLLYLVLAVVFYVSAYVIYRKRKIEQAGDFLTVNWVKPIFRGVVGSFGAIFGAMLVREVLLDTRIGCGMPLFVCLLLIIGAICYFAADMFIKKSFHVFKKKNWLGCGIFSVVVLVAFFAMYALANKYENEVPKLADIEQAEIQLGYEITLYGEAAAPILEIQKDILEQADYIESRVSDGDRYYNMVRINYQLKDGETITRRYALSQEDEKLNAIYKKIVMLEQDEENYLVNTFGKDYANITTFYGGSLDAYFIEPEDREKEDYYPDKNYDSKNIDAIQAKEIYEAIVADIKAGTLMKYNIYDGKYIYEEDVYTKGADKYYSSTEVHIMLDYLLPEDALDKKTNGSTSNKYYGDVVEDQEYVDYQRQRSVYLTIGPDCEHVINKLVELELVESVGHIWWGDAEELLKLKQY